MKVIKNGILERSGSAGAPDTSVVTIQGIADAQPIITESGQLPSTLVNGRLDQNIGSWLGSTNPTVGQKNMANSLPVTLASDQSAINFSLVIPSTFQTNQTNVTTSASLVINASISTRKSIVIRSLIQNSNNIYIGTSNAVTSGNGFEIGPGEAIDIDLDGSSEIWAISDIGINRICWIEVS